MRGELCPYDHGNDPLVVEDVNIPGIVLGFPPAAHPAAFISEAAALNPAGRSVCKNISFFNQISDTGYWANDGHIDRFRKTYHAVTLATVI